MARARPVTAIRVAVVGAGVAGLAAAVALARDGHAVELFERVPRAGAVGAGLLLQPTGRAVLSDLGLLERVELEGARIDRLWGATDRGRVILDLAYDEAEPGLYGLGVHRGTLFAALQDAATAAGVLLRAGVEVTGLDPGGGDATVRVGGEHHGPYDLVVVADGARSTLRRALRVGARARPYPWGALWSVVEDPEAEWAGVLAQTYRGTSEMVGLLPTGHRGGDVGLVSLFWSVRVREGNPLDALGLEAFARRVRALEPRAEAVIARVREPEQVLFAAYHDVVLRRPFDGRAVVLGDAAHATSPQLGQGANLALLDAWTLARSLRRVRAVPDALADYARRREAHVRFYRWASRAMTPFFQSDRGVLGPPRDALVGPLLRVSPLRREALRTLAGAKTGPWRELAPDLLPPPALPR